MFHIPTSRALREYESFPSLLLLPVKQAKITLEPISAKTLVSFPFRIVTNRVLCHHIVVSAETLTYLLATEALVLAFININLTVYTCCPLITIASV